MKWFFLSLLILILGLYVFIQTPFGQNWIGKQVTKRLSRDLQTKISIKHVTFSLLNNMHMEGVLIEDQKGDTLMYAGDVKVRITDWFIFKKEAELKYIGLENAIIKFQRTDSIWQQQFIFDYFSTPLDSTKKKKAGIKFNLKKVDMKNVTFYKKDAWLGTDMWVNVGTLNMDADKLNLYGSQYDINSLVVTNPVVSLNSYTQLRPTDSAIIKDAVEEIKRTISWNNAKTSFKIGDLKIINGTFKTDKQSNQPMLTTFDGNHILFSNINAELYNASFIGDTIFSQLKLSAKERSGLEIKNLAAELKLTPQGMAFDKLELATNRSILRNYFSMSYDDISDMGDFINKVKLGAVFDDSYIDSDDIAFFAPSMQSWKKKISIKGKVRGLVSDLVGRDMVIEAGNSTVLNGDITLTGLPDINKTFIDFKANDFRTTYSDAVSIIPALRRTNSPQLRRLQYVKFRGSFTGFIRDFVTYGTIQTNLGTVKTDINMKLPVGQDPVYSGTISTDNFRLGQLLGDNNIGSVALTGTLKGKGFSDKSRNTFIDGKIRFADYKNYRYENITVKGQLNKKLFEGVASIRDKNAEIDLNGVLDFNGATPRFDLVADVAKANLKELKFTQDSVSFRGKLNFNFTSNSIDNFLGNARITEAELIRNGRRLPFDSLIVTSGFENNVKTLSAVSNEFKARAEGEFNINELPDAFTFFLNKYYPAYIPAPRRYLRNQDFTFDITTYYADEYLQLIDSNFTGLNNSHFTGRINLAENLLNFTADVPQFKFKQFNFDDIKIIANGNSDSLVLTGETRNIKINDSLNIPQATFKVNASNDSSRVSILTGTNQTVEKADLNALVLTYNDGVKIEFDPSTFTINGKTWAIDESGELVFRSNNPASGLLVLSEGDQKVVVRSQPGAGNWNDLKVELTKLNLGDFAPFFLPKNRLEGLITGNIMVENPTGNLKIASQDLQTEFLRFDNDSLGQVKTTLEYDNQSKELSFKGNTLNQENYLGFDGRIFLGNSDQAKNNIISFKAREYQIKILERFLGTLFADMQGFLTGDVNLKGPFNNLTVTGKGRLRDAGLRVIFTQCFYTIRDTDIELTPTEINLDGIVLTDTVTNNPIYLTGGIEHESFKNMFYALDISTQKPNTTNDANNRPIQLLNTVYKDNKQFYGKVKGTGSFTLAGPQSDMYMKIDAFASTTDSSYITIPSTTSRESGIADFLIEKKYGREMNDSDVTKSATNIIYDVDVTANPLVNVRVVLDDLTGDEIKGNGSGNLNIRSGTSEPLSLRGRFDIERGSYLFTFQSFFKRPFQLRGTENYIEWNGDPMDANIKFEAQYKAENVSFAPITTLLSTSEGSTNARGEVYVIAKLTDKLFKPTIEFSLDFPSTSAAITDPELALIFQQIQKNTNELNRQVTYLIVFNSFAPSELASDASNPVISIGTISGILLNVISDQINKILNNLLKSEKFQISLNTSFYDRGIIDRSNTSKLNFGSNVNFSIGRSFFNNRFIITAGGGFDAPIQQTTVQQNFLFLKDVTMEWLLNERGTMRVSFFYRENADYLGSGTGGAGRASRIGANISLRKDVDKLGDLFKGMFRKRQKPVPPTPENKEARKEQEQPLEKKND